MTRDRRRARMAWTALFTILFILSLDYWAWDGPVRFGPFRLPIWIFYFIALQFVLAAAVHRFAATYWSGEDEAESEDAG